MTAIHPWCFKCGWRRGGHGSWDHRGCKCRIWEPAREVPPESLEDRLAADRADLEKLPLWVGRSDVDLDVAGRPLKEGS